MLGEILCIIDMVGWVDGLSDGIFVGILECLNDIDGCDDDISLGNSLGDNVGVNTWSYRRNIR